MGNRNIFGDSSGAKNPWALGTGPGRIAALGEPAWPRKQKAYRLVPARNARDVQGGPIILKKWNRDFCIDAWECPCGVSCAEHNFAAAIECPSGVRVREGGQNHI